MKRIILSTAMLALLALSLSLSSQRVTAQVPPSGPSTPAEENASSSVFACYDLELSDGDVADLGAEEEAEEEDADDEPQIGLSTAAFGEDFVTVEGLEMICVSSAISVAGEDAEGDEETVAATADEDTRVLACYGVDGSNARDEFIFSTDSSGANRVIVRDSDLMCEEASLTTADGDTYGTPSGALWLCHRVRGGDDADLDVTLDNIFGSDDVEIDSVARLCETATVTTTDAVAPTAQPTAAAVDETLLQEMYACYDLDSARSIDAAVIIETPSLGTIEAVLGDAVLLCEAALESDEAGLEADDDDDDSSPIRSAITGAATGADESDDANEDTDDADLEEEADEDELDRLIEILRDDVSRDTLDRIMSILEEDN